LTALVLQYDFLKGINRMQVETTRKRFTVEEYHRLAEVGILGPEDRTELIDGAIIQMTPIGGRHLSTVARITELFILAFHGKAITRTQGSVRLTGFTEPQPDIVLLKARPDFYRERDASPTDVLLVVEVSDTSFRYDRHVKLPHYAAAGIPEFWIVNLKREALLVFREPSAMSFATELTLRSGDSIATAAFPNRVFAVEEIIG
jgi:Uma2 family endonuclease